MLPIQNAPDNNPSFSVSEVLRNRFSNLGIPVVSDLSFGHQSTNAALPVGMIATLDAQYGVLTVKNDKRKINWIPTPSNKPGFFNILDLEFACTSFGTSFLFQ